jgi:hypothetical protein
MKWKIDLLHGTAPLASRKAGAQLALSSPMFAKGPALMSRVCGHNLRDATELFNDMERNESGGSILDVRQDVQKFSRGRSAATALVLAIRTRMKRGCYIL